ncbi:hypothetical protein N8I77_008548 [Diaporthe amygdali]|uniref:Glycosyltransferase 2-like domain-containing protein n=1 Tax=Phomopsis amygdali TaxID=1214568 RepID=A0AAD9SEE1_PHOAM|nr:hypothetical protein N8I77_008548 [Diaporthe amygdali]
MSYTGLAILGLMRAWGAGENKIASYYSSKYEPFPTPEDLLFTSKDVSVIVPLLDPPKIMELCLKSWLKNQPHEVIFVTTFDYFQAVLSALESYDLTTEDRAIIKVFHLDKGIMGHRLQYAMGFKEASGKILAVTDDQILWSDDMLKSMLPCFEDPKVGAAGGPIGVRIPEERRSKDIITGWEVAGAKYLFNGRGGSTASWVADKWTWCLAGCNWLARTAIFQDPVFLNTFITETWAGRPLNSGADNMVTRFLHQQGHVIAIQNTEGAMERNTLQNYMKFLTEVPQTYRHPYILYNTVNRILRVPVGLIHILGWVHALQHQPLIALGFLAYYFYAMVPTYRKFWATYPYMYSPCNLLAALAVDLSTIPVGLWGIFTLDTDTWVHGDGETAKKQPGIVMKATQDLASSTQAAGVAANDLISLRSQVPSATEANGAIQDQDDVQYSNLCLSTSKCTKLGHGAEQSEESLVALSEAAELLNEAEPKKDK